MKTLWPLIASLATASAAHALAEDFALSNGSVVSGEVKSFAKDGVAINTDRGVVRFYWRDFNAETLAKLQRVKKSEDAIEALGKGMLAMLKKPMRSEQIQSQAEALKGKVVAMAILSVPPVSNRGGGVFRVNFDDQLGWETSERNAVTLIASGANAVFVRVLEPYKFGSKIEVLGDSVKRDGDKYVPCWKPVKD